MRALLPSVVTSGCTPKSACAPSMPTGRPVTTPAEDADSAMDAHTLYLLPMEPVPKRHPTRSRSSGSQKTTATPPASCY
jgi:hypothetical protein